MKKLLLGIIFLMLCLFVTQSLMAAVDPAEIAVGARAISMGRAMVVPIRDSHAVFINPANLSYVTKFHLSSMFGNLLEDLSYSTITGANRFPFGWLGAGFTTTGLNGIPRTSYTAIGNNANRVVQTGSYAASDTLAIIGYSNYLGELFAFDKVYYGVSAKLFLQNVDDMSLSYLTEDLGLRFRLKPLSPMPFIGNFLTDADYGIVASNLVGTNLNQSNVYSWDGLDRTIRGGFGNQTTIFNQNIYIAGDLESTPYGMKLHLGAENKLNKYYALRGGWDAGRLTLGGGLLVDDFVGFDSNPNIIDFSYAMKFYEDDLGMAHFFSVGYHGLSYSQTPEFFDPENLQVQKTTKKVIMLQGKAAPNSEVKIYSGNNLKAMANANEQGVWRVAEMALQPGENKFTATGEDTGLLESPQSLPYVVFYNAQLNNLNLDIFKNAEDLIFNIKSIDPLQTVKAAVALKKNPTDQKIIELNYLSGQKTWEGHFQVPPDWRAQALTIKIQGKDQSGFLTPLLTEDYVTQWLTSPRDRSYTEDTVVEVKGVVPSANTQIKINGNVISADQNGQFVSMTLLPKLGKNIIEVITTGVEGKQEVAKLRIMRMPKISDLDKKEMSYRVMQEAILVGLLPDLENDQVLPDAKVTRREVNAWFKKLDPTFVASTEALGQNLNRAQAAVLIAKLDKLPLEKTTEAPFEDVPAKHVAAPAISALQAMGYLEGTDHFNPGKEITRVEFIKMLSRSPLFQRKTADLYNWNR
jgi:hypothetical protein